MSLQASVFGNSSGLPRGEVFNHFISRRRAHVLASFEPCDQRLDADLQLGAVGHGSLKTSRSDETNPWSWASLTVTGGAN
jgi:hypothetical protein